MPFRHFQLQLKIDAIKAKVFGNEMELFDLCIKKPIVMGPYSVRDSIAFSSLRVHDWYNVNINIPQLLTDER